MTVWAISLISFAIIQLPPGDYLTSYMAQMAGQGTLVGEAEAEALRVQYGLGEPFYVQYGKWMWRLMQGDLGMSLEWRRPVAELLEERLVLTVVVAAATILFTWLLAIPIGIYCSVYPRLAGDYAFTLVGFFGLAVPDFLLALLAHVLFLCSAGHQRGRPVMARLPGAWLEPGTFCSIFGRRPWCWEPPGRLL